MKDLNDTYSEYITEDQMKCYNCHKGLKKKFFSKNQLKKSRSMKNGDKLALCLLCTDKLYNKSTDKPNGRASREPNHLLDIQDVIWD
jgi:hypothetical protein